MNNLSGINNTLPSPIYLVKLNPETQKLAGPEDVTITLPEVPGFELFVAKDSVTFPNGDTTGLISVTAVTAAVTTIVTSTFMPASF